MLFRDEVLALDAAHPNVTVLTAFGEAPAAGDLTGLLDETHLDAADPLWCDADVYVCGPSSLMDSVRSHCEAAGAGDRFHQEAFTLPQFTAEAGAVGGSVRFGVSDLVVESDGRPLLDQAEAAGLSPVHGCRMGICHTCDVPLASGRVKDLRSGAEHDQPGQYIQTCVTVAATDCTLSI